MLNARRRNPEPKYERPGIVFFTTGSKTETMENYRIHFDESEREAVITILSRTNDVVINNVEPTSVGITIQTDGARDTYYSLLNQIERELKGPEGINTPFRTPESIH